MRPGDAGRMRAGYFQSIDGTQAVRARPSSIRPWMRLASASACSFVITTSTIAVGAEPSRLIVMGPATAKLLSASRTDSSVESSGMLPMTMRMLPV